MSEIPDKIRVRRVPKRGVYDLKTINSILDSEFICHIGFIHNDHPVIIPTLYGRKNDKLYIHGSSASRMLNTLNGGADISLNVTRVDGIVLARSAFHHSMNYASVILYGKAGLVKDSEKPEALRIISDHIIKGRWDEVRLPNDKELKATKVLEIPIREASAKIRTGDPADDEEDYSLNVWAGVLPINHTFGKPIPDQKLAKDINVPRSVTEKLQIQDDQ